MPPARRACAAGRAGRASRRPWRGRCRGPARRRCVRARYAARSGLKPSCTRIFGMSARIGRRRGISLAAPSASSCASLSAGAGGSRCTRCRTAPAAGPAASAISRPTAANCGEVSTASSMALHAGLAHLPVLLELPRDQRRRGGRVGIDLAGWRGRRPATWRSGCRARGGRGRRNSPPARRPGRKIVRTGRRLRPRCVDGSQSTCGLLITACGIDWSTIRSSTRSIILLPGQPVRRPRRTGP